MPQTKTNTRPGVGTHTIRLKDIPLETRRTHALKLMDEAKDTTEHAQLFELVYNPGNKGGRIAMDEAA